MEAGRAADARVVRGLPKSAMFKPGPGPCHVASGVHLSFCMVKGLPKASMYKPGPGPCLASSLQRAF